jgi:biopolymer transport protein ExbD
LPSGGQPDKPLQQKDFRTVEITTNGLYKLETAWMKLDQVESNLVADFKRNTNLVVRICADKKGKTGDLYAIIDRCRRNGITRIDLRTEPSTSSSNRRR